MLKKILSISGQPGLYKMVSQTRNGVIVENIETKKRMPAFATHKISSLEDIAIYTEDEEVLLKDVFKNIYKFTNGKEAISHKSSANEIKDFFGKVLPGYDEDRVYVSDMKKVINWYNKLYKANIITEDAVKEDEQKEENTEEKQAEE